MVSELDTYRTAQVLIREHGDAAWFAAAQRADELLDDGDTEGATVWRRVLKAVEALGVEKPAEGKPVH